MKALSIKQPWAWQIIYGGKDIENRDWKTNIRGTIAVHASKSMTNDEFLDHYIFAKCITLNLPSRHNLAFGSIIGTVDIVDCTIDFGVSEWFCGYFGFVLENPRPLITPIPIRGALGFWEVPKDIEDQINAELI